MENTGTRNPRGLMVALEGMDGAGKTTAALRATLLLKEMGYDVILTREPGGSAIAEQIRSLLLDPANTTITPHAEALLYAAARAQHMAETILPALEQGKIILCDRFLDSSLVYQGIARGLGIAEVEAINDFALHGYRPDLTLFYQVDPQIGLERMARRGNENRLDLEQETFHQAVNQGFLRLLAEEPDRFTCIDASGTLEEVAQTTVHVIDQFYQNKQNTQQHKEHAI